MTLGEKVKLRRDELKIGQAQLGELCGVSRRTIVSYETDRSFPREKSLRNLAEALGVTTWYLTHEDCSEPTAGINEEPFIQAARDSFGKKGAEEMADLLLKNEQMLAGGTLSEDQKDMFFAAISKAYFINKEHARQKFGPKKKDK